MWALTSAVAMAALSLAAGPREMRELEKGSFFLRADTPVILADELYPERARLLAPLSRAAGGELQVMRASEVSRTPDGIYIGTAAHPGGLDKRRLRKHLYGVAELGEEGYRLEVVKNGVMLAGGGERGVWHGLHTLAELLATRGADLPYLIIRDWPVQGVRGVYLSAMPAEAHLRDFAALRCTHLFFDSPDFHDLTDVRAEAWRRVFEAARENYLEPVPVFSTLHGMEAFLRANPRLIEGRGVEEAITLRGVEWAALRYPNIIAESPEELDVSISGVPCVYGKDYWIEAQPIVAPFLSSRPAWRIRRELEGAIPSGAEVTVRYSFATEDSGTLCFAAPEAREWLAAALERIVTVLRPRAIHLDHGRIGRLNADPRSRALGLEDAAYFAWTLEEIEKAARAAAPDIALMMWSDLLTPHQGAGQYGFEGLAERIPASIARLGRARAATPGEAVDRFEQLQPVATSPAITLFDGPAASAGAFQQALVEAEAAAGGGFIAPAHDPEAAAPLLDMAWGGLGNASIWTRRLNRYFDASLAEPDFAEIRGVLTRYLNRATLRGDDPRALNRQFEDYCGRHLDVLYTDEAGYRRVRSMFALMTEYLALEDRFTASGEEGHLRRLRGIVTGWQALDPDAAGERYTRILETMDAQQLFVPATILFQEDLYYYREDRPPYPQFEIPVRPEFRDAQSEAEATIRLLPGQAAVRRIGFESVRVDAMALEARRSGGGFDAMQTWAGVGIAGVRAPLIVAGGAGAPELRLTARSEGPPAVLRGLRFLGVKEPAVLEGRFAVQPPPLRAEFTASAWAPVPVAGGFLRRDAEGFAAAPTRIRALIDRSGLYIGIEASDPRPDAIVADFTQRDAPLWEQESVEVWLHPEGRRPIRLAVSPQGVQFDSEADDAGWDGAWDAVTQRTETGWNALVRVPAAWLGRVSRGSRIPFNVVRNRYGVEREESAWAYAYGAAPDVQWGELRFP